MPIAVGEEDLAEAAGHADTDQRDHLEPVHRPAPAECDGHQRGQHHQQRHEDHDRRGGFGGGEAPDLDGGASGAERIGQREGQTKQNRRRQFRMTAEIRQQHQDHAAEADDHRGPAIDPHMLLQKQRGEDHGDQRRDEGDGGVVGKRQTRQRAEGAERSDDTECAAQHVIHRPAGAQGATQLPPPAEHDENGNQREQRAAERDLADRKRSAEIAHLGPHQGKHQRAGDLERDGFDDVH